jgi:hypothetical protein
MDNERRDDWNKMIQDDEKKINKYSKRTIFGYIVAIGGIVYGLCMARREGGYIMHKEIATMMKEVDEKKYDE